jgi:hypothetical protein
MAVFEADGRERGEIETQFRSQIDRVVRRSLEKQTREEKKSSSNFFSRLSAKKRELLDFPTHFFTFFLSVEGLLSGRPPPRLSLHTLT